MFAILLFASLLCLCAATPSTKKGVGLPTTSGYGDAQLQALNLSWFYTWGPSTSVVTKVTFVPMIFSPKSVNKTIQSSSIVLGFNEPDMAVQANCTVAEALAAWPQVVAKASRVGSPAVAGNPVTGTWFPTFMAAKPTVDFVTIHWYKGPNSAKFISDVQAVINAYGKPVWITEFAPQTISGSQANATMYSQSQVTSFIQTTLAWMESEPMVEKYAWHDSKTGTSALYGSDGQLSATGLAYAAA